jgi:hypothetical protein
VLGGDLKVIDFQAGLGIDFMRAIFVAAACGWTLSFGILLMC